MITTLVKDVFIFLVNYKMVKKDSKSTFLKKLTSVLKLGSFKQTLLSKRKQLEVGNVWRNQSFGVVWGRIDSLGTRISNGKNIGEEWRGGKV